MCYYLLFTFWSKNWYLKMIGDSRLLPFRHRIDIFSYYQMKKRYLWKGSIIEQQIYQQQKIQFFYTSNSNFYWQKEKVKFLTDPSPPYHRSSFLWYRTRTTTTSSLFEEKKWHPFFWPLIIVSPFFFLLFFLVLSFSIIIIDISIITSIYKFCCCWLIRTFMFIKWQLQYENFKLRRACGIFCMNVCE